MNTMHCRRLGRYAAFALAYACAGCGGADLLSSGNRPGGLDGGLGGSYSGYGGTNSGLGGLGKQGGGIRGRGTYPKIEASFELADIQGNPFDYTENDVIVTIGTPDGKSVKVPAFFDGGKTWRVRYTPDMTGRHSITAVSRNGKPVQPDKIEKREFDASGTPEPGFVRRDGRDKLRFAFDNGNSYYPLGHNLAFVAGKPAELTIRLEKMGKAGENWSRIWMSAWDGKNLDWVEGQKNPPGLLNLDVAKRWDQILDAAEKNGVYVQVVLQSHGQFSTSVDPNWDSNPWNKKNGGFLSSPDEFFANPRAIGLTRAKYRYILARWGYSTHVMAWELFNEFEGTDSWAHKHQDEIAAWHNGMAAFLHQQDPYRHLLTTSSDLSVAAILQNMDYYQKHQYAGDPMIAANLDTAKLDRPLFFGEIGSEGVAEADKPAWIHHALWAGVISDASGAPGFWDWDTIDKSDLYGEFRAAGEFVRQSGLLSKRGLLPAAATVETRERAPLVFGPGEGWGSTKKVEWVIPSSGTVEGLASMPAYFQGSAHRDMFPSATFKVNYPQEGSFSVTIGKVSRAGGHLTVSVDGAAIAEKDFPGSGKDSTVHAQITAKVPTGSHVVKVENTGQDWVQVNQFRLEPYAPSLMAVGRSAKDYAALWIANRGASPAIGKISLSGMQQGTYKATWWDTAAAKPLSEDSATVSGASPLVLESPSVERDVALFLTRTNEKAASKPAAASLKKKS